ncbi:hypothetical protein ACFFLE_02985, partial [Salinicoccus siamensis]
TYGLTNARLEGTNNLIKTLKRRRPEYVSFRSPDPYGVSSPSLEIKRDPTLEEEINTLHWGEPINMIFHPDDGTLGQSFHHPDFYMYNSINYFGQADDAGS